MSRPKSAKKPWKAPPNWEWLQLGTFAKLVNGRAFKKSEWSSDGLPIIRIQNLNDGRRSFNFYRGTYDARHLVQKGDLLISWSGTPGTSFGAFVWAGSDSLLNQHIFKVTFDKARFLSQYLALAIQARIRDLIGLARGGVGLRHITKSTLDALEIPIPFPSDAKASLRMQERAIIRLGLITKEVDEIKLDVDRIRQASDVLLDSSVSELLSDETSSVDYRQLGDVAAVVNGRASGSADSGIRVFKTKHIYPHSLRLDRPHYILKESAAKLPADRFLQNNDVLMANIAEGTLGRLTFVVHAEPDWTVDGQVMIIRSNNQKEVLGKWIYYYLSSSRGQEQILGQRTGMPFATKRGQTHIYPTQVKNIQIPVPPMHAQDQIVRKLDSVVVECSAMREDLNNAVAALDQVRFGALSNMLREGL